MFHSKGQSSYKAVILLFFFFFGGGLSFFFPLSLHLYTYYVVSIAYVLPPDTYNKPDS